MCLYGARGLLSFCALNAKILAHRNPIVTNAIPEFLCQLLGDDHQPPAGVQTYDIYYSDSTIYIESDFSKEGRERGKQQNKEVTSIVRDFASLPSFHCIIVFHNTTNSVKYNIVMG